MARKPFPLPVVTAASAKRLRYVYEDEDGTPMCDKASPVAEILYRFHAYSQLAWHALRAGLPPAYLVRTRYPYRFKDAQTPPVVSLELTTACNLTCNYCPVPKKVRPQVYMSSATFDRIIEHLRDFDAARVHIRGWGEATIHPEFPRFARELARAARYVDLVTNGQWRREAVTEALIDAPVHRIDVSVQAGGAESHAEHRGGDLARLEGNLRALQALRRKRGSRRTIIVVRVMFRPSQAQEVEAEKKRWKALADAVIPAPIFRKSHEADHLDYGSDVFTLTANKVLYPKCYFPFNEIHVSADGRIPLCDSLIFKPDADDMYLGSVHDRSIREIWMSEPLRTLRDAHRHRREEGMKECRGCSTC